MIINPATIRNWFEFWSKNFPKTEAVAPKIINTNENPKENKNNGNKSTFFLSIKSFKDCPEIKDI